MDEPLALAVAQPRTAPCDVGGNAVEHARAIRQAASRVVVFPELSLTGYELDAPTVDPGDPALRPIVEACAETGTVALAGAPVEEDGRRSIAALLVSADGAHVAYRKSHLGGEEVGRFAPGDGPAVITVDGWRLGIGICKDTGVAAHAEAAARLGVDVYVAGLVHLPEELDEQDARGRRIAAACNACVAFASFAGPTGGGFHATAGRSTIWASSAEILARATPSPGDVARAVLPPV